jgi:hypothetical protein
MLKSIQFKPRNLRLFGNIFSIRSISHFTLSEDVKNGPPLPQWLQTFNLNISLYPTIAMPLFFSLRMGSWYLLAYGCSQLLDLGPGLAIGYAVSKLTAKIRQPVNIALAGVFSHQFPILQQIKVSPLMILQTADPKTPPPSEERNDIWLERFKQWVEGPIDKYGSALLFSGRINSFITILSVSYFTKSGYDLNSLLTSIGISESLQEASGSLAGATLINSFLLPIHMWLASKYSQKVFELFNQTN